MALAVSLILLAALFFAYILPFKISAICITSVCRIFFHIFFFVKNLVLPLYFGSPRMPQLWFSFPGKPGKGIPWLRDAHKVRGESSFVIICLPLPCTRDVTDGLLCSEGDQEGQMRFLLWVSLR